MTEHEQPTQAALILNHMEKEGPITPLQALNEYGCFRLGARIYELRQAGHVISSERIPVGEGRRIARYSLEKRAA